MLDLQIRFNRTKSVKLRFTNYGFSPRILFLSTICVPLIIFAKPAPEAPYAGVVEPGFEGQQSSDESPSDFSSDSNSDPYLDSTSTTAEPPSSPARSTSTRQNSTRQNSTGQNSTGQNSTGQNSTGQNSTGQNSTGQNSAGTASNSRHVKPKRILDDGTYIYEPLSPDSSSRNYGQLDADSEAKVYEPIFDDEKRYGALGVKLGAFGPFDLENEKNGVSYTDVYGSNPGPVALLDYQYNLFRGFGIFAIKIGTGLFMSPTGSGRFSDSTRADFESKRNEKFTMLIFPNILSAVYKFQYSDSQFFVPYAEGGAGYFGFAEIRDDGIAPKFGGAAVTVAGGGFQLLIDKLDFNSYVAMKRDYGVDHLWFVADFKAILGLNQQFDFTSQIINAGFLVEF